MQSQNREISNGPGLVDFAVGPVNLMFLLARWVVNFFGYAKDRKSCHQLLILLTNCF